MPNVRTTCPTCDIVTLEAPSITVRHTHSPARTEAVFVCPDCAAEVVHPLNERMVPVLIGAGCAVENRGDGGPPARSSVPGLDITEAEIERFVHELGRDDWFDELHR